MKFSKIALNMLFAICTVFLLWVAISFVDVALHNNSMNPEYMPYNFFEVLINGLT